MHAKDLQHSFWKSRKTEHNVQMTSRCGKWEITFLGIFERESGVGSSSSSLPAVPFDTSRKKSKH